MAIERSIEDRHGKVIKSEIVDPGDQKYLLSPRGFVGTLKNTLLGQTVENPPLDVDSLVRGSFLDEGRTTTKRHRKTLTVLPDAEDKVRIEDIDIYKTSTPHGFASLRWHSNRQTSERVLEKPEGIETAEIARSDRFGFPPKVEVFRWVSSDKAPQDR